MRKIIHIALCALILSPMAASAQPGHWDHGRHGGRGPEWHDRGPGWHGGGPGWRPEPGWRQFRRGERFYANRAPNYYVIRDYRRWDRLRPPPRGYHWVRSGDDALLVGIASGIVASVIIGAMR